jgi:hypothetical protein
MPIISSKYKYKNLCGPFKATQHIVPNRIKQIDVCVQLGMARLVYKSAAAAPLTYRSSLPISHLTLQRKTSLDLLLLILYCKSLGESGGVWGMLERPSYIEFYRRQHGTLSCSSHFVQDFEN